jgi:uncharacterized protein YyaL (SSP411 family)
MENASRHPDGTAMRTFHMWMFARIFPLLLSGLILLGDPRTADATTSSAPGAIAWQPWSTSIFDQAKREHKFVLLDLHAGWCHWCHVMDAQTYANPDVIALVHSNYIAVSVDQDSRPDLAQRYENYGWPATVVFNADGSEIVKRRGYLQPGEMTSLLKAIIADPSPGPSVTSDPPVDFYSMAADPGNESLKKQLMNGYDAKLGGWGRNQKFLNWDNVAWCLSAAQRGNRQAEKMAKQTLAAQLKLIDPVWGGVDQYSAEGDWDHPHFEKIMQFRAENIRIYVEAYAQWKDPIYLKTATGIYGFVRMFLTSPDGVVYTSQDADLSGTESGGDYYQLDDAARRKLGIPHVDPHVYARENGWFIEALARLYAVTGAARYRDEAVRAANWIIAHRSAPGGGFHHGSEESGPISMGDNLAMGRAFLDLYEVTADHVWLDRARETAGFISSQFTYRVKDKIVGYATAAQESPDSRWTPQPDFDENVSLARFFNLLSHYTGDADMRDWAVNALRFANTPAIAQAQLSSVGGLLLARQELASDPLHIAIVGSKSDATARQLFATALAFPSIYKQLEWIEPGTNPGHADTTIYPRLPTAAAYTCAQQTCSAPLLDPARLTAFLDCSGTPSGEEDPARP